MDVERAPSRMRQRSLFAAAEISRRGADQLGRRARRTRNRRDDYVDGGGIGHGTGPAAARDRYRRRRDRGGIDAAPRRVGGGVADRGFEQTRTRRNRAGA